MDYLNLQYGAATLQLTAGPNAGQTLDEQAEPFLRETPYLLIDLAGVLLTSMHLGELVNLVNAGRERWAERWPGLLLVHASEQARRTIGLARLEDVLRTYPDADAAMAAVAERERHPEPEEAAEAG